MRPLENPFEITKAVDFTDEEIMQTWVRPHVSKALADLMAPTSAVPVLLVGGKGSGRTHLMRYYSSAVQKLGANEASLLSLAKRQGYLGIYLLSGGLNAGRFSGKGQTEEQWADVFSYYMDLWLSELVISVVREGPGGPAAPYEEEISSRIASLFDHWKGDAPTSLSALTGAFQNLRRELDLAVNNAALTRTLDVQIRTTRGELVFGIPQVLSQVIPELSSVRFLYLIDELENLLEYQQKYLNTLVREKRGPVSFKLGSRLYGVRTLETLSAGEINREGSEYQKIVLDEDFRQRPRQYREFCHGIVANRLRQVGFVNQTVDDIEALFEHSSRDLFRSDETAFLLERDENKERPYFRSLRDELRTFSRRGMAPGVASEADISLIVERLRVPEVPLVEKANLLLLYQDWYGWRSKRNLDLVAAAEAISQECRAFLSSPEANSRHKRRMGHFANDLVAQIHRDARRRPTSYVGLETFITMSAGLPRNLIIILKHVYRWARFNGEEPFSGDPISRESQNAGVLQASDWFFDDARVVGEAAPEVHDAITRLANFMRALRFSRKPVEPSLCAFSIEPSDLTLRSRKVLELAVSHSLLLEIPAGQKDRNTLKIVGKYQLNPMLAPRWDLPVARRGAVALSVREANSIFDPDQVGTFNEVLRIRETRMNPPFVSVMDETKQSAHEQLRL